MKFSVKIPKIGTISADSTEALGEAVWTACHCGLVQYGASQIGSRWPVKQDGKTVGALSYNGRFWPAQDGAVA